MRQTVLQRAERPGGRAEGLAEALSAFRETEVAAASDSAASGRAGVAAAPVEGAAAHGPRPRRASTPGR